MSLEQLVARRLREVRQARGMTQADVARESGIAVHEISKLENGKRSPRLGSLERLAGALRIEPFELVRDTVPVADPAEVRDIEALLADQDASVRRRAVAIVRALVAHP